MPAQHSFAPAWLAAALCLTWAGVAGGAPLYVTTNGTGDGSSWAAATSLTNALAQVNAAGEIWIAEGRYTNAAAFETRTNNVALYGGFTNGMAWADRTPTLYAPVLDGRAAVRVLTIYTNTTVDGLVISNGYTAYGAGIYASGKFTVTLRNSRILNNNMSQIGGRGAGAYFNGTTVYATNTMFMNNAGGAGDYWQQQANGLYAYTSTVTLVDCVFSNNSGIAWNNREHKGGALYVYGGTLAATNCIFVGNRIGMSDSKPEGNGGGAGYFAGGAQVFFRNCLMYGNAVQYNRNSSFGGAWYVKDSSTTVTAHNCTFAYNAAEGPNASEGGAVYVASGTLIMTNCVFWTNSSTARGFDISNIGGIVRAGYCRVAGAASPYIYDQPPNVTLSPVMTNDPLFASRTDLHLKSKAGRWDPTLAGGAGAWTNDTVTSPCVDAGNPSDSVGAEPAPNGGWINMGYYGGASEASKSPSLAPIVVNRDVTTNVNVAILRGELVTNDTLASVTIYYGKNPMPTNTDTALTVDFPRQTGTVFAATAVRMDYNSTYYFRCYATNAYGEDWADTATSFLTGAKPPGGPDGVIHVKADAVGGETGDCWYNAYRLLNSAVAAVKGSTNEIWVATGTYSDATVTLATNVSIYGRFEGTETNRAERNTLTQRPVIDGLDLRRCINITSGTVLLDGLSIIRGYASQGAGIQAVAPAALSLVDCRIERNRLANFGNLGAGAYLSGIGIQASNTYIVNNPGIDWSQHGLGLYANVCTGALVDCIFTNNSGGAFAHRQSKGGALCISGGVLDFTNCVFIGNKIGNNHLAGDYGGGAGFISTGARVSFRNCTFRDNAVWNGRDFLATGGGLRVSSVSTTVTVHNCTLAYNTAGGPNGYNPVDAYASEGGAMYVAAGTLFMTNCVFWTNFATSRGYDLSNIGGSVKLGYCTLSGDPASTTTVYDAVSGVTRTNLSPADPLFASRTDLHLKSKGGRWDPALAGGAGAWTNDAVTSPCIDAGDPASPYDQEPQPNGRRINLGFDGNTWQASMPFRLAGTIMVIH